MPFRCPRLIPQGHRGAARASCTLLSRQHETSRSRGFLWQGRGARRAPQQRSGAERVLRRKRRVSHNQSNSRYPYRSKAAARLVNTFRKFMVSQIQWPSYLFSQFLEPSSHCSPHVIFHLSISGLSLLILVPSNREDSWVHENFCTRCEVV